MRLDQYTIDNYTPGTTYWKQLFWYFVGSPLVESYWLPFSAFKIWILRSFGAKIGQGVRIKPGVRVKFPWRLNIGDFVWIGEDTWIDNLALITIEKHVCLSQGVYPSLSGNPLQYIEYLYLTDGVNYFFSDACGGLRLRQTDGSQNSSDDIKYSNHLQF